MKLYYSPGACSLAPHIMLHESGLPFEAVMASTKTKKLADGTDYLTINPLGYVPFLVLDDGRTLHEGPVIGQYVADQVPATGLVPAHGSWERYKQQEWLTFIGTELHKGFSPLFAPNTPADYKPSVKERLMQRLTWVDAQLAGQDHLQGSTFTVADAYLFTVSNWTAFVGMDIAGLSNLVAFRARVAARPGVQAAMKAEGLLK
ncbi:MAG: glutathione transferase GstA [Polaromonas sp.]|nr:glutathione transferase GstA [Polaromonas sp.]